MTDRFDKIYLKMKVCLYKKDREVLGIGDLLEDNLRYCLNIPLFNVEEAF